MNLELTSFPAAMMDFFGKQPDGNTQTFLAELKALTIEDKADFRTMLREKGYKLPL